VGGVIINIHEMYPIVGMSLRQRSNY